MTTAILNINDAGLQLALDGELARTSPGYAVLDSHKLMVGEDAAQHAKLLPRWANNRFWDQLTTSPLPNATDRIRHHADLALAHLEALWHPIRKQAGDMLICVPGYYSQENLGLLLALCNTAAIPVRGLVDSSVIAASNLSLAKTVLHLDIHLHRITLTRLSNDGILTRRHVKTVAESGLVTLRERWANIIASQFIQTTRFDPLHDAAMEQRLFDTLPGWIATLDSEPLTRFELTDDESSPTLSKEGLSKAKARLSKESASKKGSSKKDRTSRTVTISQDTLLAAVNQLYPRIVQAIRQEAGNEGRVSLLLAPGFAGFPGLKESLQLVSQLDVIDLSPSLTLDAAWARKDEVAADIADDGGVSHVTRLTASAPATNPTDSQAASPTASQAASQQQGGHPTHLLAGHQAWPIGSSFKLDADLSGGPKQQHDKPAATLHTRSGALMLEPGDQAVAINGEVCKASREIKIGDTLSIGEHELTFIRVHPNG